MSFRTIYGHSVSENGWRMCNRDECVVANPVPYSNTAPVRRGDAATILNAWLIWYHRNVEPCGSPVWGWSATNDVATSNHLSGTAFDINAPRYPWGLRTMPAARIAKVREGLRLFEGTVYWGADWGRADEMHYQIGFREGDARLAAFAAKLNAGHLGIYGTPAPAPAPAPAPVKNMIDEEAKVSGVWLGERLFARERPCKDGVGRYVNFAGGSIYWHPNVLADGDPVALPVPTLVYEVWKRHDWEQGFLGYPTSYHTVHDGTGDVQMFQGGIIARRYGTDGFVCHGVIGDRWRKEGDISGPLGWPTSDEYATADGGRRQDFDRGSLLWHPSGAIEITNTTTN